ncbi:DUF4357 domain-containing protein [Planococcus lenghuensis]|uniref:Methionine sulfoxide reductase n=1 Tax=Planococcus lenghuensis TaxID=2213202 RepID=A0A1Q2L2R4_9BACL|nr:DUF4357 domain-containing protein [Planococcus lenghuensis]AQQ54745.1 methionine sulfoxide reductase [Planococcus lenghuensis]
MATERFIRKMDHSIYGRLYQFIEVDAETGEEAVVEPFSAGLFRKVEQQELRELLAIKSKRGADAVGFYREDKFFVQKGSKFTASTSAKCPKRYIKLREELILQQQLIPVHGQLLLMADIAFDSPRTAMGVVIGGWAKGLHNWRGL